MLKESGTMLILCASFQMFLTRLKVRRFAVEEVGPKVREMDENEMMDPKIIQGLFEQGVRTDLYCNPGILETEACS